jgi:hypothetical protein
VDAFESMSDEELRQYVYGRWKQFPPAHIDIIGELAIVPILPKRQPHMSKLDQLRALGPGEMARRFGAPADKPRAMPVVPAVTKGLSTSLPAAVDSTDRKLADHGKRSAMPRTPDRPNPLHLVPGGQQRARYCDGRGNRDR